MVCSVNERPIWFNGSIVPASEALVPVLSPTAQFGLNVFEGVRCYYNNVTEETFIFRFDCHIKRLFESCKIIGIEPNFDRDQIFTAIQQLFATGVYQGDVALRITFFVGDEGSWQANGPVGLFIAPISKPRNLVNLGKGVSACVSSWRRINDNMMPPRVKAGANYVNGRYAQQLATRSGFDLPIFLDSEGFVSEGAGSCLFMIKNGVAYTPDLGSSILESITRDTLIELFAVKGIRVVERRINRSELYVADEVFLCGSAAELTSVVAIDNIKIGCEQTVTKLMSDYYFTIADGRDAEYSNWRLKVC